MRDWVRSQNTGIRACKTAPTKWSRWWSHTTAFFPHDVTLIVVPDVVNQLTGR